ncbi:MAG: hypothetical protein GY733_21325, partial [bacterium]|nr:hypothetical protein [bacterium]
RQLVEQPGEVAARVDVEVFFRTHPVTGFDRECKIGPSWFAACDPIARPYLDRFWHSNQSAQQML